MSSTRFREKRVSPIWDLLSSCRGRGNETGVSCIPTGRYAAGIRTDGARGWRIELRDTQPRTNVQIHVGNYPEDIEGCILLGLKRSGSSVGDSAKAIAKLRCEVQSFKRLPEIIVDIYSSRLVEFDKFSRTA